MVAVRRALRADSEHSCRRPSQGQLRHIPIAPVPRSPVSESIIVIESPLRHKAAPSQWPSIDTRACGVTARVGATGVAVGVGVGMGVGVAVGVGLLVGVGL